MSEQESPSFSIEKIYVKDLSLEVPNAPSIFLDKDAPQISMNLHTAAGKIDDDIFEATLTVTVTAKLGEKTFFLIEVGQAGIFRLSGIPEEHLEPMLLIACPNILYPYAREVVAQAATRAGFAPVILQPVNFEAMYAARQQEAQAAGATAQA